MKRDEEGLVPVLEFILVFIIFIFIMSAFYSALSTQFPKVDPKDGRNRELAMGIADTLVSSTGMMSNNNDPSWETYSDKNFNFGYNHVILIGLARDASSPGILSSDKISALKYLDETTVRSTFQLGQNQLVNVTIKTTPDEQTIVRWGAQTNSKSTNVAIATRFVMVDMREDGLFNAIMTVKVFNGGIEAKTEAPASISASLPTAPLNLQAFGGNGAVTLRWNPPSNNGGLTIINYKIYRSTTSGAEAYLIAVRPGVQIYTDNQLITNGVTYYYKMTAVNSAGESPKSSEASATPTSVMMPPTPPLNLVAVAQSNSVALNWTTPGSNGGSVLLNYKIYRGTSPTVFAYFYSPGATLNTFTDTGLTQGVTYYYQVSAVNAIGESPRSNTAQASIATSTTVPTAPQNLVAFGGNLRVDLTWSPPSSNGGSPLNYYKIYSGTTSGVLTFIGQVAASLTTYQDTIGKSNGVTYYYRVSAVNSAGEGPQCAEVSATPSATGASVPDAPSGLAGVGDNGWIKLTWYAPADHGSPIIKYRIYRGTVLGSEAYLVEINNVNPLKYDDTNGITAGTTYYYKVSAVNGIGEGPKSDSAKVDVPANPAKPSPPLNLKATTKVTGGVNLVWSQPTSPGSSPITWYYIYRGTVSGGETYWNRVSGNSLTFIDTNTQVKVYYYYVTAVNANGESFRSNEASAKAG